MYTSSETAFQTNTKTWDSPVDIISSFSNFLIATRHTVLHLNHIHFTLVPPAVFHKRLINSFIRHQESKTYMDSITHELTGTKKRHHQVPACVYFVKTNCDL